MHVTRAPPDIRDGADLDNFLRLGAELARVVVGEPGQIVIHGLVAGVEGLPHDLVQPFAVPKQATANFEFEIAGGASRTVVGLADLPAGADVESKRGIGFLLWLKPRHMNLTAR